MLLPETQIGNYNINTHSLMSNRIVTSKCVGIIHLLRVVLLLFYKAEKVVNEIDLVVVITQVFIQTTIRFGNCVEL